MFAPAYKSVPYRNTERSMKPKLVVDNDNDVVVKTYYPREMAAPRGPTWRERVEKAWALKQERERRRLEAIDRAIREAEKAAEQERERQRLEALKTIEVAPVNTVKVPVRDIIRAVADKGGVSVDEILGKRTGRGLVAVRHEAICEVARQRPDMSLPEIGKQFNRDHTSIMHALQKAGKPTSRESRKHLDRET